RTWGCSRVFVSAQANAKRARGREALPDGDRPSQRKGRRIEWALADRSGGLVRSGGADCQGGRGGGQAATAGFQRLGRSLVSDRNSQADGRRGGTQFQTPGFSAVSKLSFT